MQIGESTLLRNQPRVALCQHLQSRGGDFPYLMIYS